MATETVRTISLSITFLLLAFAFASPSQSQPIASFVMMKELSSWSPGRPEKSRQVLVWEEGTGQAVDIVDNKVISLADFSYPNTSSALFPIDYLFKLNNNYAAPAVPGLIVEGRGDKIVFVMHANGRSKFISAENELLPLALVELRQKFPATTGGRTGSFISVRLLPESVIADLRGIATLPVAVPAILKNFPELNKALSSPFKFVPLTSEKWNRLLAILKLNPSAVFVKTTTGNIVRIEFYH